MKEVRGAVFAGGMMWPLCVLLKCGRAFCFCFSAELVRAEGGEGKEGDQREGAGSAMKRLGARSSAPPPLCCVALLVVAKLLTAQAPGM